MSQFCVFLLHGFQNVSDFSRGFWDESLLSPLRVECHITFHFGSFEG